MHCHKLISLGTSQVPVHLSYECAAAARQEVFRPRIFDRVTGRNHARLAGQLGKLSHSAGVYAHPHVAIFVFALEIGRAGIDND